MVRIKIDAPEPPSFTTQFDMLCAGCGDKHTAGTRALYQGPDNALVAVECIGLYPGDRTENVEPDVLLENVPTEAEQKAARERMCDGCWMVLPASGICGTCF